jgi:CHAT domain-containing protein
MSQSPFNFDEPGPEESSGPIKGRATRRGSGGRSRVGRHTKVIVAIAIPAALAAGGALYLLLRPTAPPVPDASQRVTAKVTQPATPPPTRPAIPGKGLSAAKNPSPAKTPQAPPEESFEAVLARLEQFIQEGAQHFERKAFAQAIAALEKARAEVRKNVKDVRIPVRFYHDLADAYELQHDRQNSVAVWREVVEIYQGRQQTKEVDYAQSLVRLAVALLELDYLEECKPLLKEAIEVCAPMPARAYRPYRRALFTQTQVHGIQGDFETAEQAATANLRLCRRCDALGFGNVALEVLDRSTDKSDYHLSFSLVMPRGQLPGSAARFAEWSLNSKGLHFELLAQQLARLLHSTEPGSRALAQYFSAIRAELAGVAIKSLSQELSETEQRSTLQQLQKLRGLDARLSQLVGSGTQVSAAEIEASPDEWLSIDTLRSTLPADTVLVEFYQYNWFDYKAPDVFKGWQRKDRMVAFVVPPQGKGDVRCVDLGETAPLYATVRACAGVLREGGLIRDAGSEAEAEAVLRLLLNKAAADFLRPIEEHLRPFRHWILSPDGGLWLIPWAALPLADGAYVVEKHTLSYVLSGRDVLAEPTSFPQGPATVFAAPNYNLGKANGNSPGRSPDLFRPLPGTKQEASAIKAALADYVGGSPVFLLGDEATESAFRKLSRPQVLIFSTHGFCGMGGNTPLFQMRHPLLTTGLALAGANTRQLAPEQPGEDGVLTSLEVMSADLRGTDLVVLSACETAHGRVQLGQGVIGLRQAFQMAGARSVVSTLWPIPDRETAQLMAEFFRGLAAGKDKAEALQQAQLTMIRDRRKQFKAAHPFFWAAFTLTGDERPRTWKLASERMTGDPKSPDPAERTKVLSERKSESGTLLERVEAVAYGKDPEPSTATRTQRRTEWTSEGTKLRECQLLDGKPHGLEREWHPSGALKYEAYYFRGQKYRESNWSAEGKLVGKSDVTAQ